MALVCIKLNPNTNISLNFNHRPANAASADRINLFYKASSVEALAMIQSLVLKWSFLLLVLLRT